MSTVSPGDALVSLILFAGVFVVILLVGRGITLWYFKVNEILETLKSIDEKLGDGRFSSRS